MATPSLAALYAEHHAALRGFARRLVGDPHAAEDLVHDVFVELPGLLRRYRGDCSVLTYLRAIAVNRARRHLRAAIRRRAAMAKLALEVERQGRFPSEELHARELSRRLTAALDQLSLEQRAAFVLCEVEELSADEAGLALGIPAGTVRTRLFYARQKLSALLEGSP